MQLKFLKIKIAKQYFLPTVGFEIKMLFIQMFMQLHYTN